MAGIPAILRIIIMRYKLDHSFINQTKELVILPFDEELDIASTFFYEWKTAEGVDNYTSNKVQRIIQFLLNHPSILFITNSQIITVNKAKFGSQRMGISLLSYESFCDELSTFLEKNHPNGLITMKQAWIDVNSMTVTVACLDYSYINSVRNIIIHEHFSDLL